MKFICCALVSAVVRVCFSVKWWRCHTSCKTPAYRKTHLYRGSIYNVTHTLANFYWPDGKPEGPLFSAEFVCESVCLCVCVSLTGTSTVQH